MLKAEKSGMADGWSRLIKTLLAEVVNRGGSAHTHTHTVSQENSNKGGYIA